MVHITQLTRKYGKGIEGELKALAAISYSESGYCVGIGRAALKCVNGKRRVCCCHGELDPTAVQSCHADTVQPDQTYKWNRASYNSTSLTTRITDTIPGNTGLSLAQD